MTTLIDSRRAARGGGRQRKTGPLSGGLAKVGSRGEGRLARALAHPLSDYYLVLAATALLVGLGVLMVLSASSVWSSMVNQGDAYYYLVRQIAFLCLGVPTAWWLSRRHHSVLAVLGWVGMVGSVALLCPRVFTPLGIDNFGNRASAPGGSAGHHPAVRVRQGGTDPVVGDRARQLGRSTLSDPKRLLFPFLGGFGVVLGLCLAQRDVGTGIHHRLHHVRHAWFVGAAAHHDRHGPGRPARRAVPADHRPGAHVHRVFSFLGNSAPTSDQPMNAIYALASGGWWGLGLGYSRQKWGGLYNGAQTDYVFAVLGEEMACSARSSCWCSSSCWPSPACGSPLVGADAALRSSRHDRPGSSSRRW